MATEAPASDAPAKPKRAPRKAPARAQAGGAAKPETKPEEKGAATQGSSQGKGGANFVVLGAAAVGVAAGLAANLGRKAAVQAPSALAGDWFEALKGEHRATMLLFDALQKTTDKQKVKRGTLLMQIKHALAKHAFTEEMVVYPALREAGDPEDADKLNHEHGYVKQYLYELTLLDKGSPAFLDKVAEFRAHLQKHIDEEEQQIFPGFHARLSDEKNKQITLNANREGFKFA